MSISIDRGVVSKSAERNGATAQSGAVVIRPILFDRRNILFCGAGALSLTGHTRPYNLLGSRATRLKNQTRTGIKARA